MGILKFISITAISCHVIALLTLLCRLNPYLMPFLWFMRFMAALGMLAILIHDNVQAKGKLVTAGIALGSLAGTVAAMYDFLVVWFNWFQYDAIAWGVIVFASVLTGVFYYVAKKLGIIKAS